METKESLKEFAYRLLRKQITDCTILPGTLLSEKELGEKLGVSRTPIREALNRLEQEQLVSILPKRGVLVSEITPKMIHDIYQAREIFEPILCRALTLKVSETALLKLKQRFLDVDCNDSTALIELDRDFHDFFLRASQNSYLVQLMATLSSQNDRLRILTLQTPHRMEHTQEEHLAIIDAMLKKNPEKAEEAMRFHLIHARHSAFIFHYGDYLPQENK